MTSILTLGETENAEGGWLNTDTLPLYDIKW